MTSTSAPPWEAKRTDETRRVEDVIRQAGFETVDCYRYNAASIRVLERSGFEREGLARSYLKINGRWEDHFLFAALAPDTGPQTPMQAAKVVRR